MNKSTMRTLVRRDLKDEDSGNYRWTNDEVDRMVDVAIREYSRVKPNELKATIATTNNSRVISLSSLSNIVCIFAVEFPIDKFPRQYQRFSLFGTDLQMVGDRTGDGTNSYVYYGKVHDIDATTWTIDVQHEHIIALGAVARALLQMEAIRSTGSMREAFIPLWTLLSGVSRSLTSSIRLLNAYVVSGKLLCMFRPLHWTARRQTGARHR